jgi:hypothetical protein
MVEKEVYLFRAHSLADHLRGGVERLSEIRHVQSQQPLQGPEESRLNVPWRIVRILGRSGWLAPAWRFRCHQIIPGRSLLVARRL